MNTDIKELAREAVITRMLPKSKSNLQALIMIAEELLEVVKTGNVDNSDLDYIALTMYQLVASDYEFDGDVIKTVSENSIMFKNVCDKHSKHDDDKRLYVEIAVLMHDKMQAKVIELVKNRKKNNGV